MTKNKAQYFPNIPARPQPISPVITSLLDVMKDGREYESIIVQKNVKADLGSELHRALKEVISIRKKPCLCYIADMLMPAPGVNTSINTSDERPFIEMIDAVPENEKEIDIILVTPGGSAEVVSTLVTKLRSRFDKVNFILPYLAMSAGTIFCMSGDDLIMDENASFGPIDPQVPTKDGRYVPAQALKTLIEDIQIRGAALLAASKQPLWTDVVMLQSIDKRELGNVITASKFSTDLVTAYLSKYKFRTWVTHKNGDIVTEEQRIRRAQEIAEKLCDHSKWLNHASRISRDQAQSECQVKVTNVESIDGLARALHRLWALLCFTLETSPVYKCFFSDNYALFRLAQNTNGNGQNK